jgi:hypothetical protein
MVVPPTYYWRSKMNMRLIDDSWPTLSYTNGQGLSTAGAKLEEARQIHRVIAKDQGKEVADSVLSHGLLERALERCIEIHEGGSSLDNKDLLIYCHFAGQAVQAAEETISQELSHLLEDNQT